MDNVIVCEFVCVCVREKKITSKIMLMLVKRLLCAFPDVYDIVNKLSDIQITFF